MLRRQQLPVAPLQAGAGPGHDEGVDPRHVAGMHHLCGRSHGGTLQCTLLCLNKVLERFFDTRVAVAPFRPHALTAFVRILGCPVNPLKDMVSLRICMKKPPRFHRSRSGQHYPFGDPTRAGCSAESQVGVSDLPDGPARRPAHHPPRTARIAEAQGEDASLPSDHQVGEAYDRLKHLA